MKKLRQANVRALTTDPWLEVLGARDAFAIGDCATIDKTKLLTQLNELWATADSNNDGKVTLAELERLMGELPDGDQGGGGGESMEGADK